MRNLGTALIALASLLATPGTCANQPPGKNAILLSNVQALTLRANRDTTSRRVSAAPQLKCIGHEKICALYEIETMRCKNEGYDYDEEDIQWTCTAPLPSEFKLGSTDVICEGYRNSDDPWVLKGSCGVEYRMLLTDEGEERFGKEVYRSGSVTKKDTVTVIFWVLFIGVLVFIVAAACRSDTPVAREQRRRRWGWGGGGGGGGDDVVVTVPLVRVKGGDLVFGLVLGPVERRDIRWEGTVLVGASEILLGITILERVVRGVQRRPRSRRPRLGQGLDQLGADR
ncbi:unnamed protein product [Penicillium manginii]